MLKSFSGFICITVLVVLAFFATAKGVIIHESATMGDGTSSPAYGILSDQFLGSQFSVVGSPVEVTSIGGHLYCSSGTLFGAIFSLYSPDTLPGGRDPINYDSLVAYTVFGVLPAKDNRIPLSVVLEPGSYCLIFGTNYLGAANGSGGMPSGGKTDLAGTPYFYWNGAGWRSMVGPIRFVVEGETIPEPATVLLLGLSGLFLRRRK